jgi:hypothetical protein
MKKRRNMFNNIVAGLTAPLAQTFNVPDNLGPMLQESHWRTLGVSLDVELRTLPLTGKHAW